MNTLDRIGTYVVAFVLGMAACIALVELTGGGADDNYKRGVMDCLTGKAQVVIQPDTVVKFIAP